MNPRGFTRSTPPVGLTDEMGGGASLGRGERPKKERAREGAP